MTDDRDLEARLARLAGATEGLEPRGDFEARVMQVIAVEQEGAVLSSVDWLSGIRSTSWLALTAAALIAMGAVAFAAQSQRVYDNQAALAYGAVEVGW